ncbi:hypothetical protein BC829DRAFT_122732 [Chytridium lagenaria]|nr:hypothetical protein BC829DRAFT_122732 [Chytridium lagenaria]
MGAGTADTTAITGGCYKWQMVTGAPSWNVTTDGIVTSLVPSWTTGLHARLWIIDPSETFLPLRKTPSQLSADLSSSYSSLGLFPSVTTAPQVKLGEVNFNAEGSYWELLYNTTSADAFTFAITSNHVSLINCFVSDTTIELDVQKFPPTLFTLLTPARTINGQILKVSRDACSSNVGLALTDAYGLNNIVITQSSFLTTSVGKGLATNGGVEAVAIVGFNVSYSILRGLCM